MATTMTMKSQDYRVIQADFEGDRYGKQWARYDQRGRMDGDWEL